MKALNFLNVSVFIFIDFLTINNFPYILLNLKKIIFNESFGKKCKTHKQTGNFLYIQLNVWLVFFLRRPLYFFLWDSSESFVVFHFCSTWEKCNKPQTIFSFHEIWFVKMLSLLLCIVLSVTLFRPQIWNESNYLNN